MSRQYARTPQTGPSAEEISTQGGSPTDAFVRQVQMINEALAASGLHQTTWRLASRSVLWRGYGVGMAPAKALAEYQITRGSAATCWHWHGNTYYLGEQAPPDKAEEEHGSGG